MLSIELLFNLRDGFSAWFVKWNGDDDGGDCDSIWMAVSSVNGKERVRWCTGWITEQELDDEDDWGKYWIWLLLQTFGLGIWLFELELELLFGGKLLEALGNDKALWWHTVDTPDVEAVLPKNGNKPKEEENNNTNNYKLINWWN
jgi:hypothetical protein